MEEALGIKAERRIEIRVPQRGAKTGLVEHALANAQRGAGRRLAESSSQRRLLEGLAERFGLPRVPRRIEVFDNSHIMGTNAVGAMIVAGAAGVREGPVPQVQHQERGAHARRRLRHDARGAGAAVQAAGGAMLARDLPHALPCMAEQSSEAATVAGAIGAARR